MLPFDDLLAGARFLARLPRVRLLVHPGVDPFDPEAVAQTFLEALGAGSGAERIMETVWRDAGILQIERRPPLTTSSGKILHLHVEGAGGPP